jgi:putative transposase
MPINKKYLAVFEFDGIYHIYNRTNNKELLFRSQENYLYFLKQFDFYISPIAETFAWNLLPNHFHFLIRIKSIALIQNWINSLPVNKRTKTQQHFLGDNILNTLVVMEFKRLFTSYAMAFNKQYNRKGNLFSRTFKRVEILKDNQFTQALIYIHANAQKHKLVIDFSAYPWTSYQSILSEKPTKVLRNEVLEWFGGIERFKQVHNDMSEYYSAFSSAIEEDVD